MDVEKYEQSNVIFRCSPCFSAMFAYGRAFIVKGKQAWYQEALFTKKSLPNLWPSDKPLPAKNTLYRNFDLLASEEEKLNEKMPSVSSFVKVVSFPGAKLPKCRKTSVLLRSTGRYSMSFIRKPNDASIRLLACRSSTLLHR